MAVGSALGHALGGAMTGGFGGHPYAGTIPAETVPPQSQQPQEPKLEKQERLEYDMLFTIKFIRKISVIVVGANFVIFYP